MGFLNLLTMAEKKKSFVLYSDSFGLIKQLPDDVAGRLLKHIYAYVNDENPITDELLVNVAFEPIKAQLKRDLVKWEKQTEQRKQAGLKSAEVRKQNATTVNERSISSTVNDSVSVNDIKEYIHTPTAFSFYNSLIKLGANKQLVNDWLKVRKTKKATNTETAFNKFIKQYQLSGQTLDAVLEKCVEKSWSGFEADWFKKETANLHPNGIGRTNQKLMIYKDDD